MTLLGPLLIAGFFSLALKIGLEDDSKHLVVVVDPYNYMKQADLLQSEDGKINYVIVRESMSDSAFSESNFSDLIEINEKLVENNVIQWIYKKKPSAGVYSTVEYRIRKRIKIAKMIASGIDPEEYEKIEEKVIIKSAEVFAKKEDDDSTERFMLGFGFSIFIYFFILFYGVQVMRGVIEEKTNRIVEVLVSSVKPFQLMMGKIVGIALVGLTQFTMWIILSSIFMSIAVSFMPELSSVNMSDVQYSTQVIQDGAALGAAPNIMEGSALDFILRVNWVGLLSSFLFFFLGGYLLYASMFAAFGSAVDNEADTQQFMIPVTMPLVFAYIIAILVITNPEGQAAIVFSYVPFTSPIVMLVRIAMDTVMWWEVLISMAILVLTFIGTTWLAGRIYRTGILMYGKKTSWKEMWKWIRHS